MDKIEPYRQIVQLQSEIVKISRRNRELRERCEQLERALSEGVPAEVSAEAAQPETVLPVLREGVWLRFRLLVSKGLNAFRIFRWLRV